MNDETNLLPICKSYPVPVYAKLSIRLGVLVIYQEKKILNFLVTKSIKFEINVLKVNTQDGISRRQTFRMSDLP